MLDCGYLIRASINLDERTSAQYCIKTDNHSGIISDPNRADDPEYIVRLLGQVVRVSLETVRIVRGLPEEYGVPRRDDGLSG